MLEVKNLSKIYKATVKNGVDTKALDDVSLTFPEKGMVFLLGKSGSGKSTLLNVCGGLDAPTSGEIIVKGKSSKSFSQSDFDSYRNTFVGFIFQEYNILNEFSVEDNIALALELQGKPKNKKVIAELLEQVDLAGFARRKPNTLSGGQKQRIAIARALVKSPEIIMADEPTGALDSATGKQVFDTLKKLSADKLVIVVSHDRDFAELYGDRIIELKDGKILSDVSKTQQTQTAITSSISAIDGVLCIKNGAELDENDIEEIKSFLKESNGDVIIAKNERDVKAFKQAAHINDDGGKEYFDDTDESKLDIKQYSPNDSKFIRSRLPLKHASKIGISSIKNKPVRLIFTVILCTISFVLFGLLSTLTFYNSEAMFKQTLSDSGREYVTIKKNHLSVMSLYSYGELIDTSDISDSTNFSYSDISKLEETFGKDIFGAASTYGYRFNVRSNDSSYWSSSISNIAYIPDGNSFRNKITGSYPSKEGEICISSFSAQSLIEMNAVDPQGNLLGADSLNELLGKTVTFNGESFKIVGIFDCGEIPAKYEVLKDDTNENYSLQYGLESELQDGTYLLAFFTKEDFERLAKNLQNYSPSKFKTDTPSFATINSPLFGENSDNADIEEYPQYRYESINNIAPRYVFYFNSEKSTLSNNEILLDESTWSPLLHTLASYKYQDVLKAPEYGNMTAEEYEKALKLHAEKQAEYSKLCLDIDMFTSNEKYEINAETGEITTVGELSNEERNELRKYLLSVFCDIPLTVDLTPADSEDVKIGEATNYTVVGIVDSDDYGSLYITQSEYDRLWSSQFALLEYCTVYSTDYVAEDNAYYSMIYAPFANTDEQKDMLWEIHQNKEFDENASRISMYGRYVSELDNIDYMVKSLSKIFLYVGLVFALFAILLFSNFISTSISQKRHEIGILRAVGARGNDVFKIFFSESFVIALICSALASIGTSILCSVINNSLSESIIGASIFVFGPFSLLIIVATAVLTATLATLVPVWIASRKKPVDSIKAI